MANLKDIKRRIGSVKKTRQITSAMKLVAAAKLRRATEAATSARPYQDKLSEVLSRVASMAGEDAEDPLLEQREEVKRRLYVVLTSDRGLCGPFNNALMRATQRRMEDGPPTEVHVFGRKGADFLRARKIEIGESVVGYAKTPVMELVRDVGKLAVEGFTEGRYDEVVLVYNEFVNAISQVPTFARLLPMELEQAEEQSSGVGVEFDYEPGAETVMAKLLPLYLRTRILQAFLETEAGEHAARMTAMDNATRNADDVIDELTLAYNRARQAAITTEITEIVSGAEAL